MKRAVGSRVGRIGLVVALVAGLVTYSAGVDGASVNAQQSPKPGCLPGETTGERIDAIIAILIGQATAPDDAGSPDFLRRCPGIAILPYLEGDNFGSWLGMDKDEVWSRYQGGDSLATIAATQGIDRLAAIEGLEQIYTMALDRALAAGAINERQREWIAARILPHFSWLIDWGDGRPLAIAGGDVNLDGVDEFVTSCMPGEDPTMQADNLVRLALGLPVAVQSGRVDIGIFELLPCASVTDLIIDPIQSVLVALLLPAVQQVSADYLQGKSLLEIMAEWTGNRDTAFMDQVYRDLMDAVGQAVDQQIAAGQLSASKRERVEGEVFLIIVVCLQHHHGDPLPNDFTNTTLDDEASALSVR